MYVVVVVVGLVLVSSVLERGLVGGGNGDLRGTRDDRTHSRSTLDLSGMQKLRRGRKHGNVYLTVDGDGSALLRGCETVESFETSPVPETLQGPSTAERDCEAAQSSVRLHPAGSFPVGNCAPSVSNCPGSFRLCSASCVQSWDPLTDGHSQRSGFDDGPSRREGRCSRAARTTGGAAEDTASMKLSAAMMRQVLFASMS